MTDPAPLTDDELASFKAVLSDPSTGWHYGHITLRLVATVEQTRRERDAACAALLAVLGIPDEDWQIDMWSEQYGDCVGMLVPTCICDRDHPGKGVCYCCDPINLTAFQVDAIRRARAGTERTTDA